MIFQILPLNSFLHFLLYMKDQIHIRIRFPVRHKIYPDSRHFHPENRPDSKHKIADKVKLKACVRYFHQIFIFSPNDNPPKNLKNAFCLI